MPRIIVAGLAVTVGMLATAQLAGAAAFPSWPSGWDTNSYPYGGYWGWWFLPHHASNPAPPSTPGTSPSPPTSTNSRTNPRTSTNSRTNPGTSTSPRTNPGTSTSPRTVAFSSTDRWASYATGGYTISNDEWGNGYGPQNLWVTSPTNWGVSSTQPATSGVKSYPDISKPIGTSLDSLSSATSSFSQSVPSVGDWESAYDIWLNGNGIEVMVWTYKNGNVAPLGSPVGTVSLDGETWTLYEGNNGSNPTYSFVLSSNENSGRINILDLLKYLENTKGYFSNPTLSTIQYGFEISSTDNTQQKFSISNYSASAS